MAILGVRGDSLECDDLACWLDQLWLGWGRRREVAAGWGGVKTCFDTSGGKPTASQACFSQCADLRATLAQTLRLVFCHAQVACFGCVLSSAHEMFELDVGGTVRRAARSMRPGWQQGATHVCLCVHMPPPGCGTQAWLLTAIAACSLLQPFFSTNIGC